MIEFFAMQPLSIEDPRVLDVLRGCRAGLRGQKELDTTRAPWAGTANALVRASAFNEGIRAAKWLGRLCGGQPGAADERGSGT